MLSRRKRVKEQKFVKKFGAVQHRRQYLERLPSIIFGLVLTATVFFVGGGLYDLLQKPPPLGLGSSRSWRFYVPYDLSVQYLNESIFFMIFFCIGFLGIFILNRGLRKWQTQRNVLMILLVGILMLSLGWVGAFFLLWMKAPP